MVGYLASEIFGSLPHLVTDPAALYHAHIRSEMLAMGYHPSSSPPSPAKATTPPASPAPPHHAPMARGAPSRTSPPAQNIWFRAPNTVTQ
jgi:hypothetical protein